MGRLLSSPTQGKPEISNHVIEFSGLFMVPSFHALPASSTEAGGRSIQASPRARHGTPGSPAVQQDDVGSITRGRAFLRPRRSEEPGPTGRTANCPGGSDRHRRDRRSAAQTGSLSTAPRPCGPPTSRSIPAARQRLAGSGEAGLRKSRGSGRVPRSFRSSTLAFSSRIVPPPCAVRFIAAALPGAPVARIHAGTVLRRMC